MKISKNVKRIYDEDFKKLLCSLSKMDENDRFSLYRDYTRKLFPLKKEPVTLDCQFSNRNDYKHKFKKSFLMISNYILSPYHLGEYNQEYFKARTGCKTYPQKVILALGLMGYITGLKLSYSTCDVNGHGYIYDVDMQKLRNWNQDFLEEPDLDNVTEWESTKSLLEDWLVEKQHNTILAIEVEDGLVKKALAVRSHYRYTSSGDLTADERKSRHKNLCNCESVLALHNKDFNDITRFSVDDKGGRLYSMMTRLKSDVRVNMLSINKEKLVEVDVSNAQPAFLGIILKQQHPDVESLWLGHSLSGDFYEWVIDITGMYKFPKEKLVEEIKRSREYEDCDRDKMLSRITSQDIYKCYRPIVKKWVMIFMFNCDGMLSMEKDGKSYHKHFLFNLCRYLKENEPQLYNIFNGYKSNPRIIIENGKKKKKSQLPIDLQKQEVCYIKQCLKNLDDKVQYLYTVHDCVGCLVSDSKRVKAVMEQTSMDMFGVKLDLKIEGCTDGLGKICA